MDGWRGRGLASPLHNSGADEREEEDSRHVAALPRDADAMRNEARVLTSILNRCINYSCSPSTLEFKYIDFKSNRLAVKT